MKFLRYDPTRAMSMILFMALLLGVPTGAYAQKEWNIWYFGNFAGLDFNSGVPVGLADGMMEQLEGCASIADRHTGRLLFYTDGDTVWSARHQPMANGTGLFGHYTSTQSAIIVPMPGDSNRYYIFTASAGEYVDGAHPNLGINYSVVDLTLDGGFGDIVRKNVNLMPRATEKLVAVRHANGRDYWVIAHAWGSNEFHAFRVTRSGISPAVVSAVGSSHQGDPYNTIGTMKVSPNGKKLALAAYTMNLVQIFDFNNITGQVSNPLQLPSETWEYGVSFSPDNKKLYVAQSTDALNHLYQYDLTSGVPIVIIASRTLIATSPLKFGDLQIGPDKKIYVAKNDDWLGVINYPNVGGTACGYEPQGPFLQVQKGRRRYSLWGLPNALTSDITAIDSSVVPPEARFTPSRTSICAGESIDFADRSLVNPTKWEWLFPGGNPASSTSRNPSGILYPTSGTYVAMLVASSPNGDDTARVDIVVHPLPVIVANADGSKDVQICVGEQQKLHGAGGISYQWSPSAGLSCTDCQDPIASPVVTTTYTLTATNEFGCFSSDQITVTVNPLPKASAGSDQQICPGGSVPLAASGGVSYAWSPHVGLDCYDCRTPVATPKVTTTYKVVVTNASGCRDSDEVVVEVVPTATVDAGPDVTICPGTSTMLTVSPGLEYAWSPSSGLSCTDCRSPVAAPDSTTTYTVQVTTSSGCLAFDSVTVRVRPRPLVDAGDPATICLGDSVGLQASSGVLYNWSPAEGLSCTSCRSPIARPSTSTTYTLTVTDANGCVGTDTVTVSINPAPRRVKAHIARTYGIYPGTRLEVPVILDEPLDLARVDDLIFTLHYDPQMLQLRNGTLADSLGLLLRRTLLAGWSMKVLDSAAGSYSVRLTAPSGEYLKGTGKLLHLSFLSFLGTSVSSELPFTIDLLSSGCTRVETSPGFAKIDSVCGLNLRLITGGPTAYVLEQNAPNPFNPTTEIRFSLGLDGATTLVIYDVSGREVATLVDQYLQPGEYHVTWDATGFPSGLYYCRLTSGVWSRTNRMVLRK